MTKEKMKEQARYCFAMQKVCEKRKDFKLAEFYKNAKEGFEIRCKRLMKE